jgi:MFS family permease
LAPFLVRDFGLTQGQIGILIGLFMFPRVFMALPGGFLAQRFGDRATVLGGLALLTFGAIVVAAGGSFAAAFAGRLLGGIGLVLLNVTSTKIVTDWFVGRELATGMGITLSAWPVGIALALSTFGTVAASFSWQAAIYLTAAASGIALALVALFYRDPPAAVTARRGELWRIDSRELALVVAAGSAWMFCNAGYIVFVGFGPTWLVSTGISPVTAGPIVGLASWMLIGSVPLGGWVVDRVGRVNAFITVGSLAGAATVLFITAGVGALVPWMVFFGIAGGLWAPAVMTLPGQVLSPRARATGFGVFYIVYYLGMAAAPPLAGFLLDRTGDARSALWLAAALTALTSVSLVGFRWLQARLSAAAPASA